MGKQFQLELFKTQQYQSDDIERGKCRPKFFTFIKLHEKAILIIITFFITSLISFSLGVEKGKTLITKQTSGQPLLSTPEQSSQLLLAERPEDKVVHKDTYSTDKIESPKEEQNQDVPRYTIQVATFKTQTYAHKEAKKLKNKGLEALIVSRGKFICVYVGNFSQKEEADISLNQLKRTYQDCFIRRL